MSNSNPNPNPNPDLRQELDRIKFAADRLYMDHPDEPGWEQMLCCVLFHIDPVCFNRDPEMREVTSKLLTPDAKDRAIAIHRFVGLSDLSDFIKYRVCSGVEAFLRKLGVPAAELSALKANFDVTAYLDEFWGE